MPHSGLRPTPKDRRDYDLLATRRPFLGGVDTLPDSYVIPTSQALPVPDQEAEDTNFTPPIAPLPFGCTDYAQSRVCALEDGIIYNPMWLEDITHANALGGLDDIRVSLTAVANHGVADQGGKIHTNHPAFFRAQPSLGMDYFDAARVAILATSSQQRGISAATPFFPEWLNPLPSGELPVPSYDLKTASWHNWVIEGWEVIGGVSKLRCQMLQGTGYGVRGFVYMSREVFNATMAIPGTALFTIDKLFPGEQPQPVGSPFIQMLVNFFYSLIV